MTFAVVLVGMVLSLSVFATLDRESRGEEIETMRVQAFERVHQFEDAIQTSLGALRTFRALLEASEVMDLEAFRRFHHAVGPAPGIFGLTWVPRILPEDLESFVRKARANVSPDFAVWEVGPDGRKISPAPRSEYFPSLYNEGSGPDHTAYLGFDVGSHALRRHAIEEARLSGETVVTPPIRLLNALDDRPNGFLLVAPVYEGKALPPVNDRLPMTRGVAIAVLDTAHFIRKAFGSEIDDGMTLRVYDESDPSQKEAFLTLGGSQEQQSVSDRDAHSILAHRTIDVSGRNWAVIVSLDHLPGGYRHWTPWLALLLGLVATAAITVCLRLAQGRQAYAEAVAEQQTKELRRTTDRLNEQIAERVSVQGELSRSQERLKDSIESLEAGFALFDPQWRLQLWNRKYIDFEPSVADRLVEGVGFEDLAQSGTLQWTNRWPQRGSQRPETSSVTPLSLPSICERQLEDGRWLLIKLQRTTEGGLVDVRTDITHLKDRTAELEDHRDRLEDQVTERTRELADQAARLQDALQKEREFNQLKGEFVSMVSHEFRTPLAIIDSVAQRINRKSEDLPPADLRRRVGKIRDSVRRLVSLIESTLSFSRIESGRLEPNLSSVDIRTLLQDVCDQESRISTVHRVESHLEELPDEMVCDPDLIRLAFANLLSNAIKYSPNADLVEVKGWIGHDAQVHVSVRDFGLGIPEADLPRLFDRFFRATNSSGIAGTGIGLNLTQSLVELHGGQIQVQSILGKGSLFEIRLPKVAAHAHADSPLRAATG